jgi:methylase of polypeptide subunit release factors
VQSEAGGRHDGSVRFFDGVDAVRKARQTFDDAGFTLEAVTERLGPHVFAHLAAGEVAPLVRATRAGDRLDALARLFLVSEPVPLDDARAALAPLTVDEWEAAGVVTIDGDSIRALITIRPLGGPDDQLVAHDMAGGSGTAGADHVLGISASTLALAGATIRRPIDAAFDLGTGCGIQALHAATHSRRVVAADLNPRAVAMATLTMELNGLETVTVRHGDRFKPVPHEVFELIVANPPFVISPSRRYQFRDSGLPLDELCRSIVQSAPEHLAEGGHCQLLASWAHIEGEDWRERLAGWFTGTGCDALVLEREALEPAAHAASWLRQTERPERWADEYDAWMAYDEKHHIEAVAFGLITMRKRATGEEWFRAETAPQEFVMPCGDHLGAMFELADFLETHPDEALLDVTLRVAPDVELDERARPEPGGWLVTQRQLHQTSGLCHAGDVDPGVAAIVGACDGRQRVSAILARAAAESDVDWSDMVAAALPIIRRLVEQAFLLPSGDTSADG